MKDLKHLGYNVRYVRNITDVGHLEHDADSGNDKITGLIELGAVPQELAVHIRPPAAQGGHRVEEDVPAH